MYYLLLEPLLRRERSLSSRRHPRTNSSSLSSPSSFLSNKRNIEAALSFAVSYQVNS